MQLVRDVCKMKQQNIFNFVPSLCVYNNLHVLFVNEKMHEGEKLWMIAPC